MAARTYTTGKPCRHGHIGPRYVSTQGCVQCVKIRVARTEKLEWRKAQKRAHQRRPEQKLRQREWQRHKKYGLPLPTRPCPALCECCGNPPKTQALALDHDHATGKFRGWLCKACNSGIGLLGDSHAAIQRAMVYLHKAAR